MSQDIVKLRKLGDIAPKNNMNNNNRRPKKATSQKRNANTNRKQKSNPNTNKMTSTNIPMTTAYQIFNKNDIKTHRCTGSEFIGDMILQDTVSSGMFFQYAMNPVNDLFGLTRLRQLASSYGKFRFTSMTLQIASNFSTSIGGNLIAGYSENPDIQILPGTQIFNQ
jgi:hypothetical protein